MAGRGTEISRAGRIARRHDRRAPARDARLAGLRATWVAVHRADGLQADSHRAGVVDLPVVVVAGRRAVEVDAHRVVGVVDRVHARRAGVVAVVDKADARRAAVKPATRVSRRVDHLR